MVARHFTVRHELEFLHCDSKAGRVTPVRDSTQKWQYRTNCTAKAICRQLFKNNIKHKVTPTLTTQYINK